MKKNYLSIFFLFIGLNTFSQTKIYLGLESGISIFKTKVENIKGDNFKNENQVELAPTGLRIGLETKNNWSLELGVSLSTFNTNSMLYKDTNDGFSSTGSETTASSYHFKFKRLIILKEKFTFAPYVGFIRVRLDQPAQGLSAYYQVGSGSSFVDGVTTNDSTFAQYNYKSNLITAPLIGLNFAYKVVPRLKIFADFSYFFNNNNYHTQKFVEYFKDGQSVRSAVISYGGSGAFIQIGLSWNWRDVVKPNSYTLNNL